jgi:hypothetical protein
MPVTANKLKIVAMKWVDSDVTVNPVAALKEHISVFRELGMTDDEIRKLLTFSLRKKIDKVVNEAVPKG